MKAEYSFHAAQFFTAGRDPAKKEMLLVFFIAG